MKKLRTLTIFLLAFLGLSAIFGGVGLIIDPSGEFMFLPLEILDETPFSDYLLPGILLLAFNGILAGVITFLLIYQKKFHELWVVIQGLVLISWLVVEVIMIKDFFVPLHLPYLLLGIALVILGLVLRKRPEA